MLHSGDRPVTSSQDHDVVGGIALGDLLGQHCPNATRRDVFLDDRSEVHVEDVVGAAHHEGGGAECLKVRRHAQQQVAVAIRKATLGGRACPGLGDDAAEPAAVAIQAPRPSP